jgi:C-terminal processing protease CtpA/Prc
LYVDSFDRAALVDAAIEAMLEELDPHTVYFSGEELAAMSENMEGNFEGIGVEFLIQKDSFDGGGRPFQEDLLRQPASEQETALWRWKGSPFQVPPSPTAGSWHC